MPELFPGLGWGIHGARLRPDAGVQADALEAFAGLVATAVAAGHDATEISVLAA